MPDPAKQLRPCDHAFTAGSVVYLSKENCVRCLKEQSDRDRELIGELVEAGKKETAAFKKLFNGEIYKGLFTELSSNALTANLDLDKVLEKASERLAR